MNPRVAIFTDALAYSYRSIQALSICSHNMAAKMFLIRFAGCLFSGRKNISSHANAQVVLLRHRVFIGHTSRTKAFIYPGSQTIFAMCKKAL